MDKCIHIVFELSQEDSITETGLSESTPNGTKSNRGTRIDI